MLGAPQKGQALEGLGLYDWLPDVGYKTKFDIPIPLEFPKKPHGQRKRDRAERMRLAGGPKPSLREKAYAFARQSTIVKTCQFTALGILRHYLAWMCEEGLLVRVGYGLYCAVEREAV